MINLESEAVELTVYELGFLILPSIPEDKLSDVTNAIRKVITKEGGTEIDFEEPFKETLAYSMSKTIGASRYVVSDAYLGWIKFEVDRAKALTIKSGVEKIDEILRSLMIKAPRETTFIFAKARATVEDKEEPMSIPTEEIVIK
jgi:ribosomal protein S6